jgi:hypothetical protein
MAAVRATVCPSPVRLLGGIVETVAALGVLLLIVVKVIIGAVVLAFVALSFLGIIVVPIVCLIDTFFPGPEDK